MVKKKEKYIEDKIMNIVLISLLAVALLFTGCIVGQYTVDIRLTQETADDVCQQITGNSTAVASNDADETMFGGKLICTIPSYDSTQNIIVKTNDK